MSVPHEGVSYRRAVRWTGVMAAVLTLVILVFFVRRLFLDLPKLASGGTTDAPNDQEYLAHPWLAYLHIVPGVVYLLGAALQATRRFRVRHYAVHRRTGRVVLICGVVTAVFAIAFGGPFAFGGVSESVTAVVFALWFVACLVTALVAIRRGDVRVHRRWMIRAYFIGLAVGTIRIWIGILYGSGLTALDTSFAVGFPLAFVIHATAAEVWLRRMPDLDG